MKGYACIWMEDDAPVPDKESLRDAYKRITGHDWEYKQYFESSEDKGDAFYHHIFGGWLVIESYPSATGIYKKCDCDCHETE